MFPVLCFKRCITHCNSNSGKDSNQLVIWIVGLLLIKIENWWVVLSDCSHKRRRVSVKFKYIIILARRLQILLDRRRHLMDIFAICHSSRRLLIVPHCENRRRVSSPKEMYPPQSKVLENRPFFSYISPKASDFIVVGTSHLHPPPFLERRGVGWRRYLLKPSD